MTENEFTDMIHVVIGSKYLTFTPWLSGGILSITNACDRRFSYQVKAIVASKPTASSQYYVCAWVANVVAVADMMWHLTTFN